MASYYEGRVHTVLYADPVAAFYVLKIRLDEGEGGNSKVVTARGNVPGLVIAVNTWLGFEAKWTRHETFGNQLAITKAPVLRDGWNADTAEKMLASNGVDSRTVENIRRFFGDAEFLGALGDVERLKKVPGLAAFSAAHVVSRWESTQAFFKTLDILTDMGIPPGKIRQVWSVFEDKAEAILVKNPWELVRVEGITFPQADEIALRLGLDLNDPNRIRGAVLYSIRSFSSFGHLYMTTGQVYDLVRKYVGDQDQQLFAKTLTSLHKEEALVLDRTTRPGTIAIYDPWHYKMEQESAVLLGRRVKLAKWEGGKKRKFLESLAAFGPLTEEVSISSGGDLEKTVEAVVNEWGIQAHIKLSPKQKIGVINALTHPVSLLTGLPGTGKTTSLQAVVCILQDAEIPYLLCAPTGIAAKRLATLTGSEAFTIHRAFSAQGGVGGEREATYTGIVGKSKGERAVSKEGGYWGYHSGNTHSAQVVVVDEASMVDQHLLYRLLTCTAPSCRLVFVGDHAQLPSVGPGNVLRDLIRSEKFPTVKLMTIFRQEDTSDIVFAAHAVHKGSVPETPGKGDFTLLSVDSDQQVQEAILNVAQKLYQKRVNFQVLSPRHSGQVGVTKLNETLRELLNPRSPGIQEVRIKNSVIREGDRVMVVKNDYTLDVFNGDVGKVLKIDLRSKNIEVKIFGNPPTVVPVKFKEAERLLRLAYACTVHKAQGMEYDYIVLPVVRGFYRQLQRNLYYTAITRARRKVIMVGQRAAFARSVFNAKEDSRNTLFLDRLKGF